MINRAHRRCGTLKGFNWIGLECNNPQAEPLSEEVTSLMYPSCNHQYLGAHHARNRYN